VTGFLRVLVIGAVLVTAPLLADLDPLLAGLLGVAASAVLSVTIAGAVSPAAVALGAAGALAYALFAPISLAFAGGALVSFGFAARSLRARSPVAQVAMLGAAFLAGGAGSWIVVAYGSASAAVQGAAASVASLLAAAPLLVVVDDRIAHRLRDLADRASGALKIRLLRAVLLRRRFDELADALSRDARRKMDRAFSALAGASAARLDAPVAKSGPLDARIAAYVAALTRATRAAASTHALEKGIDDAVLAELRLEGEDLEARADAIVELG
jgi:hypothetical protein